MSEEHPQECEGPVDHHFAGEPRQDVRGAHQTCVVANNGGRGGIYAPTVPAGAGAACLASLLR